MTVAGEIDASIRQLLRETIRGEVLEHGQSGYDAARTVWNGMIDRYPGLIVRCSGTADVIRSVRIAREHDILLSVKSGGHNVSGAAICDDGLMIDLSQMNAVRVDPDQKRARVEAGATWGTIDHETQVFGLATPGGQSPNIGVAGLTLGGGFGYLSRKYGHTCDNLVSADVVTADGNLVHASETMNSDLFWALRGGGGNFGIVTSFEFHLHEVGPEIVAGSLIYPLEDARGVIRHYQDFMATAPREANSMVGIMDLPAASYYPEEIHNTRVVMIITMFVGPPAEADQVLAPLRSFGDPILDSHRTRSYSSYQRAGKSHPGERTYVRSQFLETLSDPSIDTIVEYATDVPSTGATVFISPRNGAMTDPPSDATAYPHRSDMHHVLVETRWTDPAEDDAHIEWTRNVYEALRSYSTDDARVNFLTADEGPERIKAAYGSNYSRLLNIKRQWDPDNVFSQNMNIDPGG